MDERKKTIEILELDNPPANALDLSFLCRFYHRLTEIEKDKDIKGIVLTSKNHAVFSSGLDLQKLTYSKKEYKRHYVLKAVRHVYKIVRLITESKKIYFAVIRGAVIGSAVSIVCACDFRFASPDAWFWLPDPQYKGLQADGGLDLIKGISGSAYAKQIGMTNERFNSRYLLKAGLIHKIKDRGSVYDDTIQYAKKLFRYASYNTLSETKAIINRNILQRFQIRKLVHVLYFSKL